MKDKIYIPKIATIRSIIEETPDTSTFSVEFDDDKYGQKFSYKPGQFCEVSVIGVGECPISISSSPTQGKRLEFCIRAAGEVTKAIHRLEIDKKVGIRGPFGNSFLVDKLKGKKILVVAGGIGLAPLRSLLNYILDKKRMFGKVELIYGARSSKDLCFKNELRAWQKERGVKLHLTIDRKEKGWENLVGFVPDILEKVKPSPKNTVAFTCGPPIMIKLVIEALQKMGFEDDSIITTLEMKMKCGVGKCGRCNIGSKYICLDGPVFSVAQLKEIGCYN